MNNKTKFDKSTSEKIIDVVYDTLAPDRHIPHEERLAKLTDEQSTQLQAIEENAIIKFQGNIDELESALGMLRVGHHLGWKVLYIAHSKRTIRKYEDILGIKIREMFPESGPSSKRSIGLSLAEKFSNFWRVVSGDIKIENRKSIE
jgi:hypothetical protein